MTKPAGSPRLLAIVIRPHRPGTSQSTVGFPLGLARDGVISTTSRTFAGDSGVYEPFSPGNCGLQRDTLQSLCYHEGRQLHTKEARLKESQRNSSRALIKPGLKSRLHLHFQVCEPRSHLYCLSHFGMDFLFLVTQSVLMNLGNNTLATDTRILLEGQKRGGVIFNLYKVS